MADVTSWAVEIDTAGDRTFATDVAADILSAQWTLGFTRPWQYITRPSRLTFYLNNSAANTNTTEGYYSPEHGSALSGFTAGRAVRIKSTHNNEAGPLLGQPGIGDGNRCPKFEGSSTIDIYSSGLATDFNGKSGSIAVQVKAADWAPVNNEYFVHFYANANNQIVLYKSNLTNLIAWIKAGGTSNYIQYTTPSDGAWHSVVFTFDDADGANEGKLYVHGDLKATDPNIGTWSGSIAAAALGSSTTPSAYFDEGHLAHAAVWKTVLAPGEISDIYDAVTTQSAQILATQASDLIGYWKLNEETAHSGQYAEDYSGNNYDGTYSTTNRTRTHGYWWIKSINPMPGQKGRRQVKIDCEGYLARASKTPVEVATQLNQTADQLITTLLDEAALYPASVGGVWELGNVNKSELGESTFLSAGVTDYLTADTGVDTFPYAFDNSKANATLYSMLREVVESEQGRLFSDRNGKIVFWNRHHLIEDLINAAGATFSGTMFHLDYRYGANVVNYCKVQHNPRRLEESGPYTLATLRSSVRISEGETKTVNLRYADGSGNRISSTDQITPAATTDYTGNTESDGSGETLTANLTITATHSAQSSEWAVQNTGSTEVYLQAGATQRGNDKLTDFGRVEVVHEDTTSRSTYGRQSKTVNARLMNDTSLAEGRARWEVVRHKDPKGEPKRLSIHPRKNSTLMTQGLARTIGDRSAITEALTGMSADEYFIIGERFNLRDGGKDFSVQWTIEPRESMDFWMLEKTDYGELEQNTYLSY